MAEGGAILISTSGVGVAMLVTQDNLDRKTGCQGCHLDKGLPREIWEPHSQDNSVELPFCGSGQKTDGRDAMNGSEPAPSDSLLRSHWV